jgi:alkanesulfonate monooxygenase SsuD/methylene tetrahydromethanopterin reductase-like flavin-dependent oxidoreductase (luciferase family)
MRFAIDIAPLGWLAEPAAIADLAETAEAAGWDGISVWDSLGTSMGAEAADPFISLAAAAARTIRLRLIASVLALPRHRPQLVARAVATLDRFSGGRSIVGVGTGGDPGDFEPFGESFDAARRTATFDEELALVDRLLRGESVDHEGPAFTFRNAAVGIRPVQQPRPPVWVGGMKPGALRRAAAWDGWVANAVSDATFTMDRSPDEIAALVARCAAARRDLGRGAAPFDVAVFGVSDHRGREVVAAYADAGATWWLESLSPMRGSLAELRALVRDGPPARRVDQAVGT